jgi:hypothetical protein
MNTFAGGNPQLQSNKVFTSGFASQSSTPLRGGGGSVRQTSQQSFTSASLAVPSSSQRIRRSLHEQNNNSFPGTDNDGVRAETGIQDSGYGVSNRGGAGEIRDYSKERRSNKRPSRQNNNNASTFQLPEFLGQPSRSHGAGSAQVQQSKCAHSNCLLASFPLLTFPSIDDVAPMQLVFDLLDSRPQPMR